MNHDAPHPSGNAFSEGNAMIALVDEKKPEIAALCIRFGIRRLELFGSAATGAFDPACSDLDFIVDLGTYQRGVAKRYLAFRERLKKLVERPVDVITVRQIGNPYFRAEANAPKQLIYDYDAERGEAAS